QAHQPAKRTTDNGPLTTDKEDYGPRTTDERISSAAAARSAATSARPATLGAGSTAEPGWGAVVWPEWTRMLRQPALSPASTSLIRSPTIQEAARSSFRSAAARSSIPGPGLRSGHSTTEQ